MVIAEPALFIKSFIKGLNNAIKEIKASSGLTKTQISWLCFCLIGSCGRTDKSVELGNLFMKLLSVVYRNEFNEIVEYKMFLL
jgi:hypothetical protein